MASRWEQKKQERDAARQRAETPYVAPEREVRQGGRRRGAAPEVRGGADIGGFFNSLKAAPISTPARGGTAGRGTRSSVQTQRPTVDSKNTADSYYDQAREADPTGVPGQLPASAADITTTNANGVTQTFKNTGFKPAGFEQANELLGNLGVGGVGYGEFQSNNFYSNVDRDDMPQLGTDIEAFSPDIAGSYLNDNPNIDISKAYQEGSPELLGGAGFSVTDSVLPEGYLSSMQSPKGIKGDMGTNERYRSEMLNNGDTALGGLRAGEASKGLLYASGKYWQANPNAGQEGQKDFLSISNDDAKAIKASDMNAQDFFKSKLEEIKPAE